VLTARRTEGGCMQAVANQTGRCNQRDLINNLLLTAHLRQESPVHSFVPGRVVSRREESAAIESFLSSALSGPSALVLEGEAGIGKTTVWLAARERAQEVGFRVLSTRAAATESVSAYSSLANLFDEVDEDAYSDLPPPQRLALDRVLLRANPMAR
jgi:AAA ATPase-like protein